LSRTLLHQINYEFDQPQLLRKALTHRSAGRHNNERLEFLGDGLLNFVIGHALFQARPDVEEGDLSRLRASLVRESTLADIAAEIDLGEHLKMGPGELKSGGFRRRSILADALEALLGAIYLDGGFEPARSVILRLYRTRLNDLPDPGDLKDPKTQLQEHLQASHNDLPEYDVLCVEGQAHRQVFHVLARVNELGLSREGQGSSRRRAEQAAARNLLEALRDG
jgi:ribonuclease-3